MEVHHHSHHPKSWKEYVQEFLMLFFAVFLGFMSEYYLEYRAERHKEHDYLVGMKEDLKVDLTEISTRVSAIEGLKEKSLKLEKTLYKTVWTESDIDSIYLWSLKLTATIIKPNFTSNTVDQLKNAGGYRLIKNQEIVRKISEYEKWKETIRVQEEANQLNWRKIHEAQNRILHVTTLGTPKAINDIQIDRTELNRLKALTGSEFLTTDKKEFYQYANDIWVQRGYASYYQIMIKIEQEKAKELIHLLEEELTH
jgi:hypothetical protein